MTSTSKLCLPGAAAIGRRQVLVNFAWPAQQRYGHDTIWPETSTLLHFAWPARACVHDKNINNSYIYDDKH